MANALFDIPRTAKKGEIITVKIVLSHIMETGYRRDISGKSIPRNIIKSLTCTYDGAEILRIELTQAIAANPYFGFTTTATHTGPLTFEWHDDESQTYTERFMLEVAG